MKNFSLVYTFYGNQDAVDSQCRLWNSYSAEIKRRLCIIVIDDGSPSPLHFTIDRAISFVHLRALEDIKWNQPGAKNLGMKFIPTRWALLTDSDHLLTEAMATKLIDFSPIDGTIYRFGRLENGQPIPPHPNSFLVRGSDFSAAGGYDEDFCGNYGYDDRFFLERAGKMYSFETIDNITLTADAKLSTRTVVRDCKKNKKLLKKKLAQLSRERYVPPRQLRFSWEIAEVNPPLLLQGRE